MTRLTGPVRFDAVLAVWSSNLVGGLDAKCSFVTTSRNAFPFSVPVKSRRPGPSLIVS